MTPKYYEQQLKMTVDLIKKSHKIILACHMNPDGDAIGSMLGLYWGLRKMNKSVTLLCPDSVPARYITLPGALRVRQDYQEDADLAISVDCGSLLQLAKLETAFSRSQRIIEIDHHHYRTRFGDVQLVNQDVCSVGEIVCQLLTRMRVNVDKRIGECLMVSILVETSSFSRPEVQQATFDFCSRLMRLGVDFQEVSERFYWRRRLSSVTLSGLCFTRIKRRAKNRLVWSMVTEQDYRTFQGYKEDVDSVPDEMMMIEDVEVALLFREIENNMLRVSLRSRHGINIGYLASLYGGGGHREMAGCRIHHSPRTVEQFVDQACRLIVRHR